MKLRKKQSMNMASERHSTRAPLMKKVSSLPPDPLKCEKTRSEVTTSSLSAVPGARIAVRHQDITPPSTHKPDCPEPDVDRLGLSQHSNLK